MPITFPEYESFDGLGLANLIQNGVMSPAELLEAAIQRIELRNPSLNAVIHKTYDQAREMIQQPLPQGLFQGVPILLKDLLGEMNGVPISFGSRYAFNNHFTSPFDNESVKRMRAAGTVILGKTNVPEFGLSPVTEPVLYGATRNPWDIHRSPGGSSGGSAAAVASGMVPIAHAGDGGGSIRIPAAFTGIFGFKPSRGRTPTGPVMTRVWLGLVVQHVLTRSVRDSAAMLDVLSGPELGSPIALPKPEYSFLNRLEDKPQKLRIGLVDQPFFSTPIHPEYAAALKKSAQLCCDLGHQVEHANFSIPDDVAISFLILLIAETTSGINELIQMIGTKPKSDEFEKITAMLLHAGNEFSAADYAHAIHVLDNATLMSAAFFEKYDVMLTPTIAFPAPSIGKYTPTRTEAIALKFLRYMPFGPALQDVVLKVAAKNFSFMAFTALFNIGGQPAMSVPLYWGTDGMPIGIQFAARIGDDLRLLQLAKQLEDAQPWSKRQATQYSPDVALAFST